MPKKQHQVRKNAEPWTQIDGSVPLSRSNELCQIGPDGSVDDAALHAEFDNAEADAAACQEAHQRLREDGADEETLDRLYGLEANPGALPQLPDGVKPPSPPVRYIKLGPSGLWAKSSIERGEIYFGHRSVPEELASRRDRDALIAFHMKRGKSPGKAADLARELHDFYTLGTETIWITVYDGLLWWARAEAEVVPCEPGPEQGARFRRTIEGWRSVDRKGHPLALDTLSTRLTKVAAYRQTLCKVEAADYLLRKLDGEDEPAVLRARELRGSLLASAEDLIAGLHWRDFETLVDLILTRGGWHRMSTLGGTMKDADLIVEQPVTGEVALVQVKSAASAATLRDYIARFDRKEGLSRLIFVCHTPSGAVVTDRPDVIVWSRKSLAEAVMRNGLFDWLIERSS